MAVTAGYKKGSCQVPPGVPLREVWFLLLLVAVASASPQCPQFVFPTLKADRTVTAKEHSTLTLPFSLDTTRCPQHHNHTFYIYVSKGNQPDGGDFCIVRLLDGEYLSYNPFNCPLRGDRGGGGGGERRERGGREVEMVKKVKKGDTGLWLWRTGDGRVRAEVYFNILIQDNDSEINPTPTGRLKTIKHPQPATKKTLASHGFSGDDANTKTSNDDDHKTNKASNNGDKLTANRGRNREAEKMEAVGDNDNKMNEKSDEDERPVDGSVTTGVIVGLVNVVTIVVVVVVVFFLVRRHGRKTKRHPRDSMPPLPRDVRLPGQRQEIPADVTNKYNTIESVTSSHYEPLPEPRESIAVDKDGYLEPESAMKDIAGSYIELIH